VVTVGVITGFCAVDVDPSEPVHDQTVALVEFELRLTVPPTHIGPSFVAPVDVGKLRITRVDAVDDGVVVVTPHTFEMIQ
jgi:hypothetical protein